MCRRPKDDPAQRQHERRVIEFKHGVVILLFRRLQTEEHSIELDRAREVGNIERGVKPGRSFSEVVFMIQEETGLRIKSGVELHDRLGRANTLRNKRQQQ